jgi:hypothetical protein
MSHTKYNNLTSAELLSAVQIARVHSPIIEELAKRFEKNELSEKIELKETEEAAQKSRAFTCPVCEANLLGSVDLIDDCFNIEVNQ